VEKVWSKDHTFSGPGIYGGKPPVVKRPQAVKGKSRDFAAVQLGVSGSQVGRAKRLQKESPELFEGVKAGKLTVTAAVYKAGLASPSRTAPKPTKPFDLSSNRHQQVANAARKRFESVLVTLETGSGGLVGMNYAALSAVASSDDILRWFKRLATTASNIHQIRLALKECQK